VEHTFSSRDRLLTARGVANNFTKRSCQDFAIISPHIRSRRFYKPMTPSLDHGTEQLEQRDADLSESQRLAQAETALRDSEARYRELFENSRDAIYIHDLNGRYTSVNRAAEELSGYTRDEIVGKHYSNFVRPTYLKTVRENFCRKLDVPLETTYETEIACKDGTRRPVEVISRMIYRNGEPVGVQGTVRDITERKRAQRALQTHSRRLVNAQDAEREIIARELHDDIGQSLTAIISNLESIHHAGATHESTLSRLSESIDVLQGVLRRLRELSWELRPANQDEPGSVKDGLLDQPAVNI
jgi:PAS domain S-box-containing protein